MENSKRRESIMKRQIKKILAVMLVLGMMMGLCACGSKKEVGKYSFTEMKGDGVTITASNLADFGMDASSMYLEMRKNGTGTLSLGGLDEEDGSTDFEWKDGKITMDGETGSYTLYGNKIVIELGDGESITFTK